MSRLIHRRTRRFWLTVLVVAIVVGAPVLFSADYAYMSWKLETRLDTIRANHEPVTYEELNAWHEPVEDSKNAYLAIVNANELFVDMPISPSASYGADDYNLQLPFWLSPPETWGGTVPLSVETFLTANERFGIAAHDALALPKSHSPVPYLSQKGSRHRESAYAVFKRATYYLFLESCAATETGAGDDAATAIADILHVACALNREPFIKRLDEHYAQLAGVLAMHLLTNGKPSAESAELLQQAFDKTMKKVDIPRRLAMSRCEQFDRTRRESRRGTFSKMLWPRTANNILDGFDEMQHATYLPAIQRNEALLELLRRVDYQGVIEGSELHEWLRPFKDSPENVAVYDGYRDLQAVTSGVDPYLSVTIAGIALYRFHLDNNGRLPNSLEELVPKYLVDVPIDWFSGKPLSYRTYVGGYVVYTIGSDGMDGFESQPDLIGESNLAIGPGGDDEVLFRVALEIQK
jgi:hypothetical protein